MKRVKKIQVPAVRAVVNNTVQKNYILYMKMSCSLECGFWDTRATNTYALTILGSSGAWRRVSRVAPAIQCRSTAQHWHRDCMPHLPPSLHTWLITNHRNAQCRPTSRPDPHSVSLSDHQQHSLTRLHNSRLKCRWQTDVNTFYASLFSKF